VALVITATVGSSSANSFVTEAEMDAYCEGRLNATAWTSDAAALPALVEATRDISAQLFKGYRVTDTQALSWPREYCPVPVTDTTADTIIGESGVVEYATTVIPQRVKDATCELAVQFIKAGTTDIATESASDGVIRKTVDVLTTEWAAPGMRARGLNRYRSVMRFIRPLLASSGGMNSTIERG
jgi:hypothetical protein